MSFGDLLVQFDRRPDLRGRQFERLCAWYLQNAPEYRGRIRRVWLWSEWPGAWAADAGIDLVAEERAGRLWAIQAKAYAPSYAIKKADVDSFLSESSRPQFSYRLLIATTDRLGPTARRTLDGQREPVGYLLRSQLELAHLSWPRSLDDLRPKPPTPKKPFPHVLDAIRATIQGLAERERGQLIMACGTGKTLAGLWVREALGCTRSLVLVPSLSLLAQTLREWTANASEAFEYLAVCSDQTVVGADEFVQHTAQLGFPVTTTPATIAAFLRRRGPRVVFATYQSSPQIAAASLHRMPWFDLVIADEAHRCAGRASSEFATVLDARKIRSRRRLFMTATPRIYTPRLRREAGVLDVDVASMDDERVFGPVLHRLTFGDAIGRRLLSDYQVVVVAVDNAMYRAWAERGEFVTPDRKKVTDARTLAGQIAVVKAMRKYNLRRVISFHSRVNAARKFSEDLPYVRAWMPAGVRPRQTIWSAHVSGAMPSGHRDRLLLRFRDVMQDEIGLLSNARCLAEGVDVPTLDGIAFVDPRRSTVDIIQAVGRAIRRAPEKARGTIVVPVFLSDAEDPDRLLSESAFKHVWDVLKALRAHDESLGEELDQLRRRLGARRAAPRLPGKIKLDVPAGHVGADFVRAFSLRTVEHTTSSWEFSFGRLLRFVARNGHSRVPQSYRDEDDHRLGAWVTAQRTLRSRGRLLPERARQLDALPEWEWDPVGALWEQGFTRLRRYVERERHTRVPQTYCDEDGYRLGTWLNSQRSMFARGALPDDRVRLLEALPDWTWKARAGKWDRAYAELNSFADREGHTRIPYDVRTTDGRKLHTWVVAQRQARKAGRLSRERVHRLEMLPDWTWDPFKADWEYGASRLTKFVEQSGHCRVPRNYRDEDGYRLGTWVGKQRQKRSKLTTVQVEFLGGLPGWQWDTVEALWQDGFARLLRFVDREGHARVPQAHRDDAGYQLGVWVTAQRRRHALHRLSEDRAQRLQLLPGWIWNTRDALWQDGYARLLRFVKREGHARVPSGYKDDDGFRLGTWVNTRRLDWKKGTLPADRAHLLEALPGWAWEAIDSRWDDAYARLKRFAEREGHSRVPAAYQDADGFPLGAWVGTQRQVRREGKLARERHERLAELPGWAWHTKDVAWEIGYRSLLQYMDRQGDCRVPQAYQDEDRFRLGIWVATQRRAKRLGRLSEQRRRRLEGLNGWVWEARETEQTRASGNGSFTGPDPSGATLESTRPTEIGGRD